jgi:hypothetical protein
LARQGSEVCAIKFSKFDRGRDYKTSSWFNTGGETFTAEYQWRCFDDKGILNHPLGTKSGHGGLIDKASIAIALLHLPLNFPKNRVKCGNFKLFWIYPTFVSFSDGPWCGDYSIELAPTKLTDFEKIAKAVQEVKWYKCDEHRNSMMYIPLDDL